MVNKMFHAQNRNTDFIPSNIPFNVSTENISILYSYYTFGLPTFIPEGWRLPTQQDLETLILNIGGVNQSGRIKNTSNKYWYLFGNKRTNDLGLNVVGAGSYGYDLLGVKEDCTIIASTGILTDNEILSHVVLEVLESDTMYLNTVSGTSIWVATSLRLIKNDNVLENYTDYDGNTYGCVKIKNQIWMDRDYKCTHTTNGLSIQEINGHTDTIIQEPFLVIVNYTDSQWQ